MSLEKTLNTEERDLLIELRTEMRAVRIDIKQLSDNTAARLTLVESSKIDKEDVERLTKESDKLHQDHENRLRFIEKYMWGALGVLAVGQVLAELFIK